MKFRSLMLVVLCLTFVVSGATAREVATATPIDPSRLSDDIGAPVPAIIGNLNPAAFLLSGWFTGQESYAVVFDPSQQVQCDNGFEALSVNMILGFDATQVPVTFDVYAGLGTAVWDAASGCFVPGDMECQGETFTVTIDVAGNYNITIPLACDCAFLYDPTGAPYKYYLSMTYPTAFSAQVVSDGVPASCLTFNDFGAGYEDLNDYFGPGGFGNVNLSGESVCCDTPVATENRTWGDIKSLFR